MECTGSVTLPKGLLVANVLASPEKGKVPVRVLNLCQETVRLMPRSRIAVVSRPQKVVPKQMVEFEEDDDELRVKRHVQCSIKSESQPEQLSIPVQMNQDGLSEMQREELNALLRRYSDVFSKSDTDYGYTTTVTHSIPTGDAQPIKQRHRRVPPHVFQEFKRHVQDLVSQGVLNESRSPWASPAVIVIKKTEVFVSAATTGDSTKSHLRMPTPFRVWRNPWMLWGMHSCFPHWISRQVIFKWR